MSRPGKGWGRTFQKEGWPGRRKGAGEWIAPHLLLGPGKGSVVRAHGLASTGPRGEPCYPSGPTPSPSWTLPWRLPAQLNPTLNRFAQGGPQTPLSLTWGSRQHKAHRKLVGDAAGRRGGGGATRPPSAVTEKVPERRLANRWLGQLPEAAAVPWSRAGVLWVAGAPKAGGVTYPQRTGREGVLWAE